MTARSPDLPLLERAAEVQVLGDALSAAAAGGGRIVVIEGEPGIGKSRLLAVAQDMARSRAVRTLHARGTELERHYPYGVALRLLEPLVRDRRRPRPDLFVGPAAGAAWLFGRATGGVPDGPADPFSTIHGLYWLVLNAAEDGPLLIAIDDAQWVDEATLRLLHYLAQRVDELAVTLVTAFRTRERAIPDSAAEALRALPDAIRLRPAPLSEHAVRQLLASADVNGAATDGHEVWAATRGNPFFVTELVRERRPGGSSEGDRRRPRVGEVPESIAQFVEARIGRLSPAASAVAEAVAILGDAADVRRVGRLAGTDDAATARLVGDLARAGILDPSVPPSFLHPIVRTAVYDAIPAVSRRRAHREAALLLRDEDVPVGVIAAQLLEAEAVGDPIVVDMLLEAAAASAPGEPAAAVRLLERARAEPPADEQRASVLVALARADVLARGPEAVDRYDAAIDTVGDPVARAGLLLELGLAHVGGAQWRAGADAFERGLRELGERAGLDATGRQLADRLEAGFVSAAWVGIDQRDEAERTMARVLAGETLGSVHRELAVWVAYQQAMAVSAPAGTLVEIVHRAVGEAPIRQLVEEGQTIEFGAGILSASDDLDHDVALLSRALAASEEARLPGKIAVYLYCRAAANLFLGRVAEAIADAQASDRVAELGWETFFPANRAILALALLERGDLDGAAAAVDLDPKRWGQRIDYALLVPLARGRIALARGDAAAALELFDQTSELPLSLGIRSPTLCDWRTWRPIALAHLGRRDEARQAAEEAVSIAREWGARWPLAACLRAAAAAEGGARAIDLLHEALDVLADSPGQLVRARVLVDLGAALRRGGHVREARQVLVQAADLAHRCGTLTLLERAREELVAAGSRPRRYAVTGVEALTPSERRVAQLAAEGKTNREIAQVLFVTPKAVEFHLSNAYPKLGIGSRQELAAALVGVNEGEAGTGGPAAAGGFSALPA